MARAISRIRQGIRDRSKSRVENKQSSQGGQSIPPESGGVQTKTPEQEAQQSFPRSGGGSGGSSQSFTPAPAQDLAAIKQAQIQEQQAQARVREAEQRRELIAQKLVREDRQVQQTRAIESDIPRRSERRQITPGIAAAKFEEPSIVKRAASRIISPLDSKVTTPTGQIVDRSTFTEKQERQFRAVSSLPLGTQTFAFASFKPVTPQLVGEARIVPQGRAFNVRSITKATEPVFDTKAFTFSEQAVKDVSKTRSISRGRAITFSEKEATISKISSESITSGRASLVKQAGKIKASKDIEKGFISESVSRDILSFKQLGKINRLDKTPISQSVSGVITKSNQGQVVIASTKDIGKKISQPNIKIDVGFGKFPSDTTKSQVNFIKRGTGSNAVQSTLKQQIKTDLVSPASKSIQAATKASEIKSARSLATKSTGFLTKVKAPTSLQSSKGITGGAISIDKTQSVNVTPAPSSGVLSTPKINQRVNTLSLSALGGRSRTRQRTTQVTRQEQRFNQLQTPTLKQSQRLRSNNILKLQSVSRGRGSATPFFNIPTPKTPGFPILSPTKGKSKKISTGGLFDVSVRRKGKFRTVGTGLTGKQAINVGQSIVGGSLAATFKVSSRDRSISSLLGKPKGFKRRDNIFIEAPSLRLSTSGEVKSIQAARRKKKKKK